jgi:hypothetical protein
MFAGGYLFLYCFWRFTYVVSKVEKLHIEYLLVKRMGLLLLLCFHFLHCLFGFVLFYFLSLSSCYLFIQFSLVVWGFFFFCFYKHFLCNNPFVSCSFPMLLGLHCLVCCFLVVYSIISLVVVWVSHFLVSLNIFLQQSICFLKMIIAYNLAVLLSQLLGVPRFHFEVVYMLTPKSIGSSLAKM